MNEIPDMTDKPLKNASCAVCGRPNAMDRYPHAVCPACSAKAVNADGTEPQSDSMADAGDNPVFIDGHKCWRRYRFGGYVTMRDDEGCETLPEFHRKVVKPYMQKNNS